MVQLLHPYMTTGKTIALLSLSLIQGQLDESQAGIKTTGRNLNNKRYADDTTPMAESEEELNSLLMKLSIVRKLA